MPARLIILYFYNPIVPYLIAAAGIRLLDGNVDVTSFFE
jgi:hypothetical protein